MAKYQPMQRPVVARILTTAGWVTGTFNIPQNSIFADYMNRPSRFDILTEVDLESFGQQTPFLMLQRTAMIMIVMPASEESDIQRRSVPEHLDCRQIYCLMSRGILQGSLDIIKNIRVSDYFSKKNGFVMLSNCRLTVRLRTTGELVNEEYETVMLNAEHLLGVSDTPPKE